MIRTVPETTGEGIELYIRTYYSLLRSSGDIRIRSLEETHEGMLSSLHLKAESAEFDASAFTYAAFRLPDCLHQVRRVVMGQADEVFVRHGLRDIANLAAGGCGGAAAADAFRWAGDLGGVRFQRFRHRRPDPLSHRFSDRVEQAALAADRHPVGSRSC